VSDIPDDIMKAADQHCPDIYVSRYYNVVAIAKAIQAERERIMRGEIEFPDDVWVSAAEAIMEISSNYSISPQAIVSFAILAERERCAQVCEQLAESVLHPSQTITDRCAAAIREG